AKGIDPAAVERAGRRATAGPERQSNKEVIRSSLERLESPTEGAIVEYCTDRGIEEDAVRTALEKLRREGEITRRNGQYRLL
ncbi:MAG: replication protein H, partial [Halodesulfurarchaeum sp.]